MALLPAQKKGLVLLVKADHYGLPFALAEVGLRVTSLLAAIPVFLRASGLLRFRLRFVPDLAWIALISGGFAGIWAFLRTGLILRTLREPLSPPTSVGRIRTERGILNNLEGTIP